MFNNSKKIKNILNLIIILGIFLLPYYLFNGKLYIGGDDTRLLYVYPLEFLKNISFFSWYNFSSVGSYNPNQFTVPFTVVWALLGLVVKSRVIIDYFSFSLPLILGYIYFQKLVVEIIKSDQFKLETMVGSLVYILSPILILNQLSVFLYAAWLIGLLPILSYYFLRYIHEGKFKDILKAVLYSIVLSLALFSIPWFLGYFIPLVIGFVILAVCYKKIEISHFIKRTIIFFMFIVFSQLFWLLPFVMTFLGGGNNSFGGKVLSQQASDTFVSTVLATASGSVLFPLLNLFHRQIAFEYNWGLKSIYQLFYDKILIIDILYLLLIFGGLFFAKTVLNKSEIKRYLLISISFVFSLFFFTVNIGPLKQLFLWFGVIPGMVMFRNFYDKFALGYALLFSLVVTYALIILAKRFPKKRILIVSLTTIIVFINFSSIKDTIVRPLWKTTNIYSNIMIPDEYTDFMNNVRSTVPPSANAFSLPYNIASYTFIKDSDSNNIFAGTSPIKIFAGVNDFSGDLSFPGYESSNVAGYIINKDYTNLERIFQEYNISYLFVTKNVPQEVKNSYLFNKNILYAQDNSFIKQLTDKKLLVSSSGNYIFYSLKHRQSTIQPNNVTYKKINPTQYLVHISHIQKSQKLIFLESFHRKWKLYPEPYQDELWCNHKYSNAVNNQECVASSQLSKDNELLLFFQKPIFEESHKIYNQRNNNWNIDAQTILDLGQKYYKNNPDGTIDAEFTLYFLPQSYFYFGIIISSISVIILGVFIFRQNSKKKDEK